MVYQLVPVAGGALQLMTRLPAAQRAIDTATRIIYPRGKMTADMMSRALALEANSSADDVPPMPDPNRPQPPGYDAATGQKWDINNQRPVEEAPPLTIKPAPAYGGPDLPPLARAQFQPQAETPPLPPRRPANLPRESVPLPPERPAEFNRAREQAGNVLSSRQMYQAMDPNDERAGTMQFILAAAKEAQEQRAAREAAGKAMGGAAGYSHGGYASGGSTASTGSSGSGNSKDAALLKALEIIHHMIRTR